MPASSGIQKQTTSLRGLTSSKLECLQKPDLKVAAAKHSPFKKRLEPLHEVSV